ncbi:hypothetical protein RvY_05093 [Ramazzottius varieornatus]|uniref:CHCH domain-containing protein n=1 Tax=Ramazzottius varieornatus TaxID=947166 RepID=A0A1D1UTV1_RAMVA|nr:hypothetical protein RvY_05093 [Ramazzottius varieornatus]
MGNQESQVRNVQFQRGRDYVSPIVISENVADRLRKASTRSQLIDDEKHPAKENVAAGLQSDVSEEPVNRHDGNTVKSEEENDTFPNVIADDGSQRGNVRAPGLAQQRFGAAMPLSSSKLSFASTNSEKGCAKKGDLAAQAATKISVGSSKKDTPQHKAAHPEMKGRHESGTMEDVNPLTDASVNELEHAAENLEKAYGTLSFNAVSPLEECLRHQLAVTNCYEKNPHSALTCSRLVKSYITCCEKQKQKLFRHLERTHT